MSIGRTFKEALQKGIRSLEPSSPWRAPIDTPVSLLREKNRHAAPRPHSLAVRGAGAWYFTQGSNRANENLIRGSYNRCRRSSRSTGGLLQ